MTPAQNVSHTIDTRIGTLEFTHDFANGYPTDATVEKLYDERDFQRACQAYLWSLPAVSFTAWQRGITKELGARNGQIVAILSYEARRGILTANATTPYYLGFADLSAGPLVMEMPPRGVQGGISDAWQNAIPGTEAPGTYLVLAPGQKAPDDVAGYTVRQSPTFNIFLGVRLTDADPERAKQALAQLQMYPYAQRDNPPKMEILDAGTKAWSGLPPRGMEYWERLDDVIQREPIEPRDIFFHAMLRPLGLEKGKPFKPDARQTKILTDAALVGEAMAKANSADRRFAGGKYRPDAHWDFALQLDADDPDAFWNLLDERASWFYEAVGAGRGDGAQAARPFIGVPQRLQGQGRRVAGRRHVVSPARSAQSADQAVLVGHGLRRRHARTDPERAEDRRSLVAHGPAQERRTARWTSIADRRRRPASRRTGSRPSPARTGSRISGSTSRPRPTSIAPGRCRTSSRSGRTESLDGA